MERSPSGTRASTTYGRVADVGTALADVTGVNATITTRGGVHPVSSADQQVRIEYADVARQRGARKPQLDQPETTDHYGSAMPNTFVLVHGGGHGGWCWQRVARLLRADGDEVYTPTLTGFGERSHLPVNDFEVFVEDVTALIEFEDLENVVLVGHSMGCVVTPRVAERVADRLSRVVWLAGPVTLDGETVLAAMPTTPEVDLAVTVAADGSLSVDHDLLVAAMLQDGTNEDREWVRSRHRDHPKAIQVEPGRLSAFLTLGLPTAYVLARDDLLLPPTFARGFADRLGVVPIEIPGSHDCMVSRPADVAAALSQLVD